MSQQQENKQSNQFSVQSSCPSTGIKYLPKSGSSSPTSSSPGSTPTSSSSPGSTPTGGSFSGSGYLNGVSGGSQTGCLISAGTWYSSGTCATYTATPSGKKYESFLGTWLMIFEGSGFTLKSSKGSCGISSSKFTCGSGVTATVFTVRPSQSIHRDTNTEIIT